MRFKIVYPENRIVDEETIETWYIDAKSNDEIDVVYFDANIRASHDYKVMAEALDDAGIITLSKILYDEDY